MPTITIRNLDEQVKQRLRVLADEHGRSMEAEAREILTRETLLVRKPSGREVVPADRPPSACLAVRGTWKGRMTTDKILSLMRGG